MMHNPLTAGRSLLIQLIAGSLLAACTELEASFEPACAALEGDRIVLADRRFEWDHFTDQIRIGPDDLPVDPFPDYPKRGSYRIDRGRVELTTAAGERLPDWYLVESDERLWLLAADEHAAWLAGAGLPTCALSAADRN
jgi:hypothetical protein